MSGGWRDEHPRPTPLGGGGAAGGGVNTDGSPRGRVYVEGSLSAARPGSPNTLLRRAFERAFNRPAPAGVRIHDGWDEIARRGGQQSRQRAHGAFPRSASPAGPAYPGDSLQPQHALRSVVAPPPQQAPGGSANASNALLFVGSSSAGAVAVNHGSVVISGDDGATTSIPSESLVEIRFERPGSVTLMTAGAKSVALEFSPSSVRNFLEACKASTEAVSGMPCPVRCDGDDGDAAAAVPAVCDMLIEGLGCDTGARVGALLEELHRRLNAAQRLQMVEGAADFCRRHARDSGGAAPPPLAAPPRAAREADTAGASPLLRAAPAAFEVPSLQSQRWAIPPAVSTQQAPASPAGGAGVGGSSSSPDPWGDAPRVSDAGVAGAVPSAAGDAAASEQGSPAPAVAAVTGVTLPAANAAAVKAVAAAPPPRAVFLPRPKPGANCIHFPAPPDGSQVTIELMEGGLRYSLDNVDPRGPLRCLIYDGMERIWFPELGVSFAVPKDKSQWGILGTLREMCLTGGIDHNIPVSLETTAVTVTLLRSSPEEAWGVPFADTASLAMAATASAEASPAERVGMTRLTGWIVTHANKIPVTTRDDLRAASKPADLMLSMRLSRPRCIVCQRQDRGGEFRKSGFKCKECVGKKHGAASPEGKT